MDGYLARLERTLGSQYGLVTLEQLDRFEISASQRQSLIARKWLRRVRPRVYGVVGAPDSWERGLLALVLSVGGSVASHSSAARLWQFAVMPEESYEVTTVHARRARVTGATVHRSLALNTGDVTRRAGIACTTFERTLCDCTSRLTTFQLSRVLDDGLRRNVASLARLDRCAEGLESGPGRRMSIIRALLAERGLGYDPGGSRSELDLLAVFRRSSIPEPLQQHWVTVDGRRYRPDFAWPAAKVFAEFYGTPWHTGASAMVADSRRLTDLSAAGWVPLVFTYASTEREIVERTKAALTQRGFEPGCAPNSVFGSNPA